MKKLTTTFLPLSAFALLALTSCGEKDESKSAATEASVDSAIAAVFVDTEPAEAITVIEARKSAKPGDTVTISGKIAGAISPFTEGFATAVLADTKLETCDLVPGDQCTTPWDACCVDPAVIKASRLSIQVVGDDGRPVAQSLKGVKGLKEMDSLVVTGTVAEGSTAENLILNVSGVFQK